MRSSLALLSAFAASAYTQAVTPSACLSQAIAVPSCALSCISSAASRAGCGQFDLACQCSSANSMTINSYAQGCVINACTPISNALAVASSAAAVCSCVATAGGGSSGATTSAAAGGSGSTSSASMSASAGSSGESSASMTMSMSSGSGSASGAATTSGGSSAATGTQTTIGPATTETFSMAGGVAVAGSVGGVAAALLGVIAYL